MDPKLWVFSMDHCGTVDSPGTAGEGSGDEMQRPQHGRVTDVLGLTVLTAQAVICDVRDDFVNRVTTQAPLNLRVA
jgi:hypothetical protein